MSEQMRLNPLSNGHAPVLDKARQMRKQVCTECRTEKAVRSFAPAPWKTGRDPRKGICRECEDDRARHGLTSVEDAPAPAVAAPAEAAPVAPTVSMPRGYGFDYIKDHPNPGDTTVVQGGARVRFTRFELSELFRVSGAGG